jgi:hypothetical protein
LIGRAAEKVGTGFSLRPHDQPKIFDLAAGRSLLSSYAPPPPDVPPANIQLMARTRDGSGLFCAWVKSNFPTNLLLSPSHSSSSTPFVILNLFQDNKRRFFVILKQVQDDDRGLGGCAQNTFLQITIWVIRVASCRRRSRTLVGMTGTLAGKPVGTVGAIGCVLQPEKGPVASSSEQRKHGWMWRETVLSVRTAFGGLRTFPPMDSMPASKGGPGAIA